MWGGLGAGVGWGVVHTAQLGNWREKSMEEEEEVEVGEEGKNSQDTLHVYRLEEFIKKS